MLPLELIYTQAAPQEVYNYHQLSLGYLPSALGQRYAIPPPPPFGRHLPVISFSTRVAKQKLCLICNYRRAPAREMNKHQRGYAGSGKKMRLMNERQQGRGENVMQMSAFCASFLPFASDAEALSDSNTAIKQELTGIDLKGRNWCLLLSPL